MSATTDLTFPSSSGRPMRAALALPAREGRRPAVIVIHEIFGLNDDIRRMTGRFADLGYVALAPDLYDGDGLRAICIARTLLALNRGQGAAFADLDAARRWLVARPDVDASRIGVAGFCMGGGFALLYAARGSLGAAATFYGDVPRTAAELSDVCPVLGGFGGRDKFFVGQGERLEAHLTALGVPHDVRIYPDAGHSYMSHHTGFMATIGPWLPMAAGHDPAAEADSWARIERFFGEHLG